MRLSLIAGITALVMGVLMLLHVGNFQTEAAVGVIAAGAGLILP